MTEKQWETRYHYKPTENKNNEPKCALCLFGRPRAGAGWSLRQYLCDHKWDARIDPRVEGYYICDLWKKRR